MTLLKDRFRVNLEDVSRRQATKWKDVVSMRVGNTIYADYQASTPVAPEVQEALCDAFEHSFANPHSFGHILGLKASAALERARGGVASLVNADAEQVIFTSGASEANNLSILGLLEYGKKIGRNRILVSPIEHKCVLEACREAKRRGFEIEYIPVDGKGYIDIASLDEMLGEDVLLVSVMSSNNEIGALQEIEKITQSAKTVGALTHIDHAQGANAVDVDINELGADLISLSAHKIYGPKGIGALVVSHDVLPHLHPLIFGGGQEHLLRSGTVPAPLCIGFAKAVELLGDNKEEVRLQLRELSIKFFDLLSSDVKGVFLNGPSIEQRHPGNLNVRFEGVMATDLLMKVQKKLCLSTGSACTSGIPEPSHVLRAIGIPGEEAEESIRISFGRYSDDQQVHEAVDILTQAVGQCRALHVSISTSQ